MHVCGGNSYLVLLRISFTCNYNEDLPENDNIQQWVRAVAIHTTHNSIYESDFVLLNFRNNKKEAFVRYLQSSSPSQQTQCIHYDHRHIFLLLLMLSACERCIRFCTFHICTSACELLCCLLSFTMTAPLFYSTDWSECVCLCMNGGKNGGENLQ
jgi:hypothetical protein